MMIEKYYSQLQTEKIHPDIVNLVLLAKWQRCNITVMTSKQIWSLYPDANPNIVIGFKGKDPNKDNHPGRWVGTYKFRDASVRSKFYMLTYILQAFH